MYLMFTYVHPALFFQAGPDNIIIGSHVWVEDPGLAWIDGEVVRINGNEVHVKTTNWKTVSAPLSFFLLLLLLFIFYFFYIYIYIYIKDELIYLVSNCF